MLKDRNLGMGDEGLDITVEAHASFSAVISSCLLTAFLCHFILTALGWVANVLMYRRMYLHGYAKAVIDGLNEQRWFSFDIL